MDRRMVVIALVVLFLVGAVVYSCGRKSGPAEGSVHGAVYVAERA